ncbi:probable pectinesterase 29 [Cajanus cajan]|uniref:pectinesterase n=1 Tax=Cajanus cajan TaxID=3821 RepID=A0A151QWG7_CAJCA|nr:probable pectinesterase 29 [Cajanus cajan]KYP34582.1 putative pectinesterase 29 [Cajanus cajan]
MQFPQSFLFIFMLLVIACSVCESQNCTNPPKTITVSKSGKADFQTIQSAIDSVQGQNSQWIHIQISAGVYSEQVLIPMNKPCIYLEGAGSKLTSIEWSVHPNLSAAFYSQANNTIASDITFKNTLNLPISDEDANITQAVAARIHGDKCAFFNCSFLGVQDTLYDEYGRHYYRNCYIQGGIDFIFGNGQSIFEASQLYFSLGKNGPMRNGCFTAQERNSPTDSSGFVFKNCNVSGTGGQALLGRSLRAYARVIIANSFLSDVVAPEGWNARTFVGHEETITFVEAGNTGPGANMSKRVTWLKHISGVTLDQFLDISFIDKEGWTSKLPPKIFI